MKIRFYFRKFGLRSLIMVLWDKIKNNYIITVSMTFLIGTIFMIMSFYIHGMMINYKVNSKTISG
jgi:hypothetical protein